MKTIDITPPNAERILFTKIIEASGGDFETIEDEILKVQNDPAHKIVIEAMQEFAHLKSQEAHNRAIEEATKRIKELEEGLLIYINADNSRSNKDSILTHEQQHRINIISMELLNSVK